MKARTHPKPVKVSTKALNRVEDWETTLRLRQITVQEREAHLRKMHLENWEKILKLAKSFLSWLLWVPILSLKVVKGILIVIGASADPASAQSNLDRPNEPLPAWVIKGSKTDPQWNWLSQRYLDKFRVLLSAIQEFYDSLEKDNPFSESLQIEKNLAELKDEDAETVDASIAAALRQADEREANEKGLQNRRKIEASRWLTRLTSPSGGAEKVDINIRQALSQAALLRRDGESTATVKDFLRSAAEEFLKQLKEKNPKLHSDFMPPGWDFAVSRPPPPLR